MSPPVQSPDSPPPERERRVDRRPWPVIEREMRVEAEAEARRDGDNDPVWRGP